MVHIKNITYVTGVQHHHLARYPLIIDTWQMCFHWYMFPLFSVCKGCITIIIFCKQSYTMHSLTHWGRVMNICVGNLTIIGSDNGWSAPSHYLNQCLNIVDWTLRNKLQWNFYRNSNIFIHEKMHLKMASAKWRPFSPGLNMLTWPYMIQADTHGRQARQRL